MAEIMHREISVRTVLNGINWVHALREIKPAEQRGSMIPDGARQYINSGKRVTVGNRFGYGCNIPESAFNSIGAMSVGAEYGYQADMITAVKEPLNAGGVDEFALTRPGQVHFRYLHSSASKPLTMAMLQSGATYFAYETTIMDDPLVPIPMLFPMSIVAGMESAAVAGALGTECGARGKMMNMQKFLVIGGGTVGSWAAAYAYNMGAEVTILDINPTRPRQYLSMIAEQDSRIDPVLQMRFNNRNIDDIAIERSDPENIWRLALSSDTIIGAVLLPGGKAPTLLPRDLILKMSRKNPGAVIIDPSCDQEGIIDRSLLSNTTHYSPTYMIDENGGIVTGADIPEHRVVVSRVPNMPAKYAEQATIALSNATLPFGLALAQGFDSTMAVFPQLIYGGLNIHDGWITHETVARDLDLMQYYKPVDELLG